jgi:hypothetical protein
VTRRPRLGRDRVKSGNNSDIAEVKRLTHSELRPTQARVRGSYKPIRQP